MFTSQFSFLQTAVEGGVCVVVWSFAFSPLSLCTLQFFRCKYLFEFIKFGSKRCHLMTQMC